MTFDINTFFRVNEMENIFVHRIQEKVKFELMCPIFAKSEKLKKYYIKMNYIYVL